METGPSIDDKELCLAWKKVATIMNGALDKSHNMP